MILRSIRVENWRCFLEPAELGPFADGLNVLNAPNATGKSTLFEALLRSLLDGHRVGGQDVEAIRPWGRSLTPAVTVEFTHGAVDYRITKTFLDRPSSLLERKEGGNYARLAEGDAADEQVRAILSQHPPGRGLSRPENWGLAQVLWAPQGSLVLKDFSRDLVDSIRASLGLQISGGGAGPVEQKLDELYGRYFTPTGRPRMGRDASPLVTLGEKLTSAIKARDDALRQQQAFDEAARRVEELRARRIQAKRDAVELARSLQKARAQAATYASLAAEGKQRQARARTAEVQYGELKQRIESIDRASTELAQAQKAVRELEEKIPAAAREVEEREKQAAKAKAAVEDARKGRRKVDEAEEQAALAQRLLDAKTKTEDLTALAGKIKRAQDAVVRWKTKRAKLLAPDAKALRAMRKAIKERDEAKLQVEAALITLEIVPEKDGTAVVVTGEEPGKRKLRAGAPTQIKGSPEVVADLPGVARLRASGPAGSVEEHRQAQARAEARLAELTEPFGTDDIEALEALSEKANELDRKVAEAETQRKTLLSGRSMEDIQEELAKLSSIVAKIIEQCPDWQKASPDCEAMKTRAEKAKGAFIEKVEAAETEWDKAQTALAAAREQRANLATRLDEAQKGVKSLQSRLDELVSDRKSQTERQAELKSLALTWDAARASLEQTEESLAAFGDDPAIVVTKLEKQIAAAESAAEKALSDEKSEEGRLAQLAASGPYSALAVAEEELARVRRELGAEELHSSSIELLHDMVSQRRTEVTAAVAAPVEAMATRIFHRIAGARLGRVQLGESFEPCGVVPELARAAVGLESISGGELEQLHLATRLALASVLAKEERQLVVLDDVLTATDTGRFARVMTILEEAAQHLQVLILTCHPGRYGGLDGARFFDLESILRGGVETQAP